MERSGILGMRIFRIYPPCKGGTNQSQDFEGVHAIALPVSPAKLTTSGSVSHSFPHLQ